MSERINQNNDKSELEISIGGKALLEESDSNESIVILFYKDNLVMTYDSKKKLWELPLSKRKQNETSLDCAKRGVFEKTGAIMDSIFLIGYYTINEYNTIHKTSIYVGSAYKFETRSERCDTDLVKLFDKLPCQVADNKVYNIVLAYIYSRNEHS